STQTYENIRKDIIARMRNSTQCTQSRYNLRHRQITYKKGDYVWKRNFVLSDASKNFSAKLAPKFIGPFQIKT
ncbi:hypothetical protein PPYR_00409, partial [Photinus pyralis]